MRSRQCLLVSVGFGLLLLLVASVNTNAQDNAEDTALLQQQINDHLKAGDVPGAASLARRLVETTKLRFGNDSKEYADALMTRSIWPNEQSRSDISQAIKIYETLVPEDPILAEALLLLASHRMLDAARDSSGRNALEAKPLIDRALAILGQKPGADSAKFAAGLTVLGRFHRLQKDPIAAESSYLRAFAIFERTLGANDRNAISTLYELEWLYRDSRRHDDALRIWRQLVDIMERSLGPDHLDTLTAIQSLAAALRGRCNDEEAASLERRILPKMLPMRAANMERRLAEVEQKIGSVYSADTLNEIGGIYVKLDRLADARKTYDRAIAGLEKMHAERPNKQALSRNLEYAKANAGIAEIDRLEGRLEEAERGFRDAIGAFDEFNHAGSVPRPFPLTWLESLETVYRARRLDAEADGVRERADKMRSELNALRRCNG
jgi:tetratricopeptide (TPR) repeat protein